MSSTDSSLSAPLTGGVASSDNGSFATTGLGTGSFTTGSGSGIDGATAFGLTETVSVLDSDCCSDCSELHPAIKTANAMEHETFLFFKLNTGANIPDSGQVATFVLKLNHVNLAKR